MPLASLYLERLQWLPYLDQEECRKAGSRDCQDFLARLQNKTLGLEDCHTLTPQKRYALSLALKGAELVPPVESLALPQPTPPGLIEINDPGPETPVLVSGNSEITVAVLTAVLATTVSSFYLLLIDCRGDTVDMAMVLDTFTPVKVENGLRDSRLTELVQHRQLIIPGWCAPLREALASSTGWQITVGPICALELPLFFGEKWQPPDNVS
jgi:CO dehydrogenase/acetyl-CoA synthase gamma subunit (corrinoid Fe-S protein)